jgi:hypothetical protein
MARTGRWLKYSLHDGNSKLLHSLPSLAVGVGQLVAELGRIENNRRVNWSDDRSRTGLRVLE